ncbi:MAG: hypothetical protein JJ896_12360 [Rhodothermales bacterium]|nr:hypothetical protein [Rhodothermales bacterium]MBO6780438.1 hypothetical protein [Rhodothermales bacterium]
MDIRNLTGTTIADALAEARSLWGDSVVMLQAEPESAGRRARIAVGLPSSDTRRSATSVDVLVQEQPEPRPAFVPAPAPGALRRPERGTGVLLHDRIRPATDVFARLTASADGFQSVPTPDPIPEPEHGTERLEPATEPIALNPVFMQLIRQGLRPRRARQLAEISRETSVTDAVRELARSLPPRVSGRAPRRVAFVGAPGAGKTSLVVRAALSRVRAGRRAPWIVVVAPSRERMRGWQDPTSMFESFDLQVLRCSREALASALEGLDGDVLIDTPAGFRMPNGTSGHVRLVVDARAAVGATAREGERADSVVVTHVDQAPALGHVTERLIVMQTPVAALLQSGITGEGLEAWDPARFARRVCDA